MSNRVTSIRAVNVKGLGLNDWGRKSRPDMIALYRRFYEEQARQAAAALAVPDDELIVETFTGIWAQKNVQVVT